MMEPKQVYTLKIAGLSMFLTAWVLWLGLFTRFPSGTLALMLASVGLSTFLAMLYRERQTDMDVIGVGSGE